MTLQHNQIMVSVNARKGMVLGNQQLSSETIIGVGESSETSSKERRGESFEMVAALYYFQKLLEVSKSRYSPARLEIYGSGVGADAVKVLMKAYFRGKAMPVFDYRDIRPKGARLITSGGKAPGPEPLRVCLTRLQEVLDSAVSRNLTSLEAHDMQCHIADAVLSGGIRRAAMIALFSPGNESMLTCKGQLKVDNWELSARSEGLITSYHGFCIYKGKRRDIVLSDWDYNGLVSTGTLPWYFFEQQRGRANNSAVLKRGEVTESQFKEIWKKVEESNAGEPGIFWTDNTDWGTNPCCVTGDMLVTTEKGQRLVRDLVGNPFEAVVWGETFHSNGFWSNGVKEVFLVETKHGYSFKATADHKILTDEKGWVELQYLTDGDKVVINNTGKDTTMITSITPVGKEEVYDCTVEEAHCFSVNGIIVHNCEVSLRPFQLCNLSETNVSDVESQEDLNSRVKAAAFLGTLQAAYTDFHYLRPVWRETTEKEALIGVGMTGIGSGAVLGLDLEQASKCVLEENERVAKLLGINVAARATVIKPSGTTSLVVGSSSGIHAWHDDYYIRRMRVGKNESLYRYMLEKFPQLIEDCFFKPNIEAVMSFPQKAPEGAIYRTESFLDLLERVKRFNLEWIAGGHRSGENKNNVSCTISLKKDEWEECGRWMWENKDCYTGISVLPYDGGSYVQAPFESCTKEVYEELSKHLHGIDLSQILEVEDITDHKMEPACAGGVCEIAM